MAANSSVPAILETADLSEGERGHLKVSLICVLTFVAVGEAPIGGSDIVAPYDF